MLFLLRTVLCTSYILIFSFSHCFIFFFFFLPKGENLSLLPLRVKSLFFWFEDCISVVRRCKTICWLIGMKFVERSEICQGEGMGRYRFRKGGTWHRTLTERYTSSTITHAKQPGSILEIGKNCYWIIQIKTMRNKNDEKKFVDSVTLMGLQMKTQNINRRWKCGENIWRY